MRLLLATLTCSLVLATGSLAAPVHAPAPARAMVHSTNGAAIGLPHAKLMLASGPNGEAPIVGSTFGIGLPLQYGGGDVEVTHTDYVIFWQPPGVTFSPLYKTLVPQFFQDVGGSTLFATTTQYYQTVNGPQQNIANSGSLGGTWTDTRAYTSSDLTDAEIQAEVVHAMAVNGWTGGIGHQFFVYTGANAIVPTGFCAYHSFFTSGATTILYANMLYGGNSGCTGPSSPNGDLDADSVVSVTSHELWETITDPTIGPGWTALDGDEGSDQCNFIYGSQDGVGADTYMNGHPYIVQTEWDNNNLLLVDGCTMG